MENKKIVDTPGQRKIHMHDTPSMGGIPMFLGAVFALVIWLPGHAANEYKYLFGALILTFVIGLRDDLIPLRPIYKLLSQLIPAAIVIYLSDIHLVSFYDIGNIHFPIWISWLLTLFVIVVITNSINLIDGLDGLAGSVSFISLSALGGWFFLADYYFLGYIIFAFLGGILSFLIYNWQPSKIFMGDTGALLLGFLLSCMIILFINKNHALAMDS
ncbi:MAG: MraY family glycosyltransferase, partial [Fulvivirga sp.]|nr:MraY family glycosyltransferase [Fulvivirga sp.]